MRYFVLVGLLCLKLSFVQAQLYPSLQLSTQPVAGQTVTISYDPAGTVLQAQQEISCFVFLYDKEKKTAEQQLTFKHTGNKWSASIQVPDNIVLLHLLPASPDGKQADNNNGAGYLFPVFANGKPVQYAYYRMSQLAEGTPLDNGRLKADHPMALTYLKEEIERYPAGKAALRNNYFNMLANSPEPADKKLLISELLNFKTDAEPELTMHQRYLLYLGEQHAADSIAALLRTKFPTGMFVKEERAGAIKAEKDLPRKTALYQVFMQQFPDQGDRLYGELYAGMAKAALDNGDEATAAKYAMLIRSKSELATFYNKTALEFRKQEQPEKAQKWAALAVQAIDTTKSYAGWDPYLTMAGLLYDQKDYPAALKYALPAYAHMKNKEATSLYVQLLTATGKQKEAMAILEQAVRAKQASVQMKAQLKELYEGTGNKTPFATYIAALLPPPDSNFLRQIKAGILMEPAGPITLLDIKGKPVSLSSLTGKIVVLDFWATWCKPCIASFPAMQQVMQQFPDVTFLFIATFESGDALENVKKFAKDNPYPFTWLLDEKVPGGQTAFKAFSQFKVPSVPHKLVLDKQGNIRFRSGGYSGNDEELITELTAMIRLLR